MEKFDYIKEIKEIKIEDKLQLIIEKENFDNKILEYAHCKNNDTVKDDISKMLDKYQLPENEKIEVINSLLRIVQKYRNFGN